MSKRRSVPDDLMGNILNESPATEEEDLSGSRASPGSNVSWGEGSGRVGVTFNLSKQLVAEVSGLHRELRSQDDAPPSKSEIAEAALRLAVEDARENGEKSGLSRRLAERRAARGIGGASRRRSVDESGLIFETNHDENGQIIDEDIVGNVADLPILDEYVDERGRLVSLAKDELGNTFEQIMDDGMNVLGARLLQSPDEAR